MSVDMSLLNTVTQEFLTALQKDAGKIKQIAMSLFAYLAVIQLSISALVLTLSGADLQKMAVKLLGVCTTLVACFALLQYGGEWVPAILNGFIEIGKQGGVQAIDPSALISQALGICGGIIKGFAGWGMVNHPFVSFMGTAICIIIVIIYGFMTAELTIILVKSYLIVAIGGLFFAFGAMDFTRPMMQGYFRKVIGLGLKLMTLYLLLGVGQNIGQDWAQMTATAAANHELTPMFVILIAIVVYYMLLKNIPPFIAELAGVGGFRNYGDAAIGTAMTAGFTGARVLRQGAGLAQSSMAAAPTVATGVKAAGSVAGSAISSVASHVTGGSSPTGAPVNSNMSNKDSAFIQALAGARETGGLNSLT